MQTKFLNMIEQHLFVKENDKWKLIENDGVKVNNRGERSVNNKRLMNNKGKLKHKHLYGTAAYIY